MKNRTLAAFCIAAFTLSCLAANAQTGQTQKTTTQKTTQKKKTTGTKAQPGSTKKGTSKQTAAKKAPPGVVVLKAANGNVRFSHTAHTKDRGIKCETCHHASKPEKPLKAAQERCGDCHTRTPAAPMKTKLQAAFHNPTATAGTCIDCHKAENAKGRKAPTKCQECHKKETA